MRDSQAALAAAGERASIARELHDVVAHHVSLMAVQAEAAASLLPGHADQARSSVDIIGQTAREALTELRRLLGVLRGPAARPATAPSPSLDELGALLGVVRSAGLAVDLHVTGQPCQLAPGVDLTAYRIVQEALTNTLRHAPQASATVTVGYEPGYVTVAVVDSGPGTLATAGALPASRPLARPWTAIIRAAGAGAGAGAVTLADQASSTATADRPAHAEPRNPPTAPVPPGFGLAGIVERVASCGGTLTVGPTGAGGLRGHC